MLQNVTKFVTLCNANRIWKKWKIKKLLRKLNWFEIDLILNFILPFLGGNCNYNSHYKSLAAIHWINSVNGVNYSSLIGITRENRIIKSKKNICNYIQIQTCLYSRKKCFFFKYFYRGYRKRFFSVNNCKKITNGCKWIANITNINFSLINIAKSGVEYNSAQLNIWIINFG